MELDSTEGTSQNSWSIGRRCKRGDAFSRPLLIIREAWPYCPSLFLPTIGCTKGASYWSAGGHGRVEIPVPIPNTEVKRSRADGTAARPRESRSLPAYFLHIFSNCWRLYIVSFETDSWMTHYGFSNECSGVHSRVEIPVPIPNTEVKRSHADGTAVRLRESR